MSVDHSFTHLSITTSFDSKSSDFLMKAFDLDENDDHLIASSLVDHLLKIDDQVSDTNNNNDNSS